MSTISSINSPAISFGLSGRVCVVTGGAQGIGEACCRRFARENAEVVIADIDDVRGSALASELGGLFVHCDVGDKTQVDAMVSQTMAAHGRIDVLVNNAGIFKAADFLDVSEADFDAVLRVNLKGSFLVGQAVARVMASSGWVFQKIKKATGAGGVRSLAVKCPSTLFNCCPAWRATMRPGW